MSASTTAACSGVEVSGDWRHRAACRDVDPELFQPEGESGPLYMAQVAAAKAVCAGCPVRAECLEFALVALPYGIAGGLTPAERRRPTPRGGRRPVRPVAGSRSEVKAAGRAAVAGGCSAAEAARVFGVALRTAQKWAAEPIRTAPDALLVTASGGAV